MPILGADTFMFDVGGFPLNPAHIAALQAVCGPDTSYRSSDDTYVFGDTPFYTCPSYLFVLPEIIDNSQTFHYRLEHYGNYNFADFCVHFVNFDEKKSSP